MKPILYYKLNEDRTTTPFANILAYLEYIKTQDPVTFHNHRFVGFDTIGNTTVSTMFYDVELAPGLDKSQPLLFETTIMGGKYDGYQLRYSTWQQAADGHKEVLAKLIADPAADDLTIE